MNKKKLLDKYPLEILIKVINDMGDYILDVQEEEGIVLPDVILQALTIGSAVINESKIDFKELEQVVITNNIVGLS